MALRQPASELSSTGLAMGRIAATARTMPLSAAGDTACAASHSAWRGSGWHSISNASAPAATAAAASDGTQAALPAAWLGSTAIGRSVRSRSTVTALTSSVLRVAVSNVRMPRSQRTTFELPSLRMYSALIIKS